MSKIRIIESYVRLAEQGDKNAIDAIMRDLNKKMTIAQSKFIDFALGHVSRPQGVEVMQHYLFNGTQIQRNYCALYFARRGEYLLLRKAYDLGLVDAKQAFSR
jgi:hypothetical protein